MGPEIGLLLSVPVISNFLTHEKHMVKDTVSGSVGQVGPGICRKGDSREVVQRHLLRSNNEVHVWGPSS